jgi:hypothetical protein
MFNIVCQPHWAKRCLDSCKTLFLVVSVSVFLEKLSIRIDKIHILPSG